MAAGGDVEFRRVGVGMRISVAECEAKALEKLHIYNNINPPKRMAQLIGHVGIVTTVSNDGEKITTRFYTCGPADEAGQTKSVGKTQLNALDVEWSTRAINPCPNPHFSHGDQCVWVNVNNMERLQTVTVQDSVGGLTLISATGQQPYLPLEQLEDVLLPVYVGKTLNMVLKERSGPTVRNDRSPRRLIHGPLPSIDGSELLEAVRHYTLTRRSQQFMRCTQKFPEQVNIAVEDRSPLQLAAELGNWPACVALIAMGGDREGLDSMGNTLLHLAAKGGHVGTVEGLLLFIPQELNRPNGDGDTAVHLATRGLHAACVERLLSLDHIQPNIQNKNGDTPLHVVTGMPESENKRAILGRLLSCIRVTVHLRNVDDLTALQNGIVKGYHASTMEFLQARPALLPGTMGTTAICPTAMLPPLHSAALFARRRILESIIELGADVNRASRGGRTPLHFSVLTWSGSADRILERLACIQALINAGCNLNIPDVDGATPLHLIVKELNNMPQPPEEIIKSFRAIGLMNSKLDELAAKLRPHWALSVAAYFCIRGADIAATTEDGATPVNLCKWPVVAEMLVEFAGYRSKPRLPESMLAATEFDSSGVTMCTFNCEDNVADVIFSPCEHRVVCRECVRTTPLRRCPLCYLTIQSASTLDGSTVEIGVVRVQPNVSRVPSGGGLSEDEARRIAEEAAAQAKQQAEHEKHIELRALRDRLDELEMAFQCAICLDSKPDMVFGCGHTACQGCASALSICHICRKTIEKRQPIFS